MRTTGVGYAEGSAVSEGRSFLLERILGHALWALTLVLVFMGALVKSHEAGLSVPDWPTTYGQNMFLFPPSEWRANVFYEHTHRLAASFVGFLTLVFCVRLLYSERRGWVKVCGAAALVLVIAQGVLGGLTVRYLLPAPLSIAHGVLAQTFLLLVIFLAYVYSAERARRATAGGGACPRAAPWAITLTGAVWIQLVLGAVVRHTESGLAIPDFPTMGGRWAPVFNDVTLSWINNWRLERSLETGLHLPDVTLSQVLIHGAHRFWAVAIIGIVCILVYVTRGPNAPGPAITRSVAGIAALLVIQLVLGAYTVLSAKGPMITSLHVATGAALLGLCALCAMQALPTGIPSDGSGDRTVKE
ncbi:MAG: hypothetical protein AMXMBFR4_16710 [Candidatus Hydrogenedentota bacterium]